LGGILGVIFSTEVEGFRKQPLKHFSIRVHTVVLQMIAFEHGPTFNYDLFTVAIVTITDNNQLK
jgi:hypothetical protein